MIVAPLTLYLTGAGLAVVAIGLFVRGKQLADRTGGGGGVFRAIGGVVLVIAVLGALFVAFGTKEVYVFHGSVEHGGITHDRLVVIGSGTVSLHGGKSITVPSVGVRDPSDDIFLVNDSDRKLSVEVADYSSSRFSALGGGGGKQFDIEIGEVGNVRAVDNIGPADPLPDSVESETDFASRTWVTW